MGAHVAEHLKGGDAPWLHLSTMEGCKISDEIKKICIYKNRFSYVTCLGWGTILLDLKLLISKSHFLNDRCFTKQPVSDTLDVAHFPLCVNC